MALLQLPPDVLAHIYDLCDARSRVTVGMVLHPRFRNRKLENQELMLVEHALAFGLSPNATLVKFVTKRMHKSQAFLRISRQFTHASSNCMDLQMCLADNDLSAFRALLADPSVEVIIDRLSPEDLHRLRLDYFYSASVELLDAMWNAGEQGRRLFRLIVHDQPQIFAFNVINYANRDLAMHLFRNGKELYDLDLDIHIPYLVSKWGASFSNRMECMNLFFDLFEVSHKDLEQFKTDALRYMHLDAFLFLRKQSSI
jgi:hypothetical protein